MPKPAIWCNADLLPEDLTLLVNESHGFELLRPGEVSGNLGGGSHSPELEGCEIAFGQPNPEQVIALPNLRWVHLTSAGYTRYDRDDLRAALRARGARLTNSSSVFDEPCAQHLLAFMLAGARQLLPAFTAQGDARWNYMDLRPATRILADETVLLVGFGAIARRLAQLLSPFNLRVWGVRRQVTGQESVTTYPIADLARLLPEVDHVVNILPASTETNQLFDAAMFHAMRPGAWFYNVGRGTTVDQDALLNALETKRLSGAYLDVTDPEPLPAEHPLWRAPNCYITPHTAGGRQQETHFMVRHFLDNLEHYRKGEALRDQIV